MNHLSIRWKMSLISALVLTLVVTIMAVVSIRSSYTTQQQVNQQALDILTIKAENTIKLASQNQALNVNKVFDSVINHTEMIVRQSQAFQKQFTENKINASTLRENLVILLHDSTRDFTDYLGIYIGYEPNQLDNEDANFANASDYGSNSSGRFGTYWARTPEGEIVSELLTEEDLLDTSIASNGAYENSWYSCSIMKKSQCILQPYFDTINDHEILMTSVTLPIMSNNKAIGMVGIDMSLTSLNNFINQVDNEFANGAGRVILIDEKNKIVADDSQSDHVGKSFSSLYPELAQHLGSKRDFSPIWGESNLSIGTAIPLNQNQTWTLVLEIPSSYVLADITKLAETSERLMRDGGQTFIFISIAVVVTLGLGSSLFIGSRIATPLQQLAQRFTEIASGDGDLTQRVNSKRKDELGRLGSGFDQFLTRLQSTISELAIGISDTQKAALQAAELSQNSHKGVVRQNEEVDHVASASAELSAMAQQVTDNANEASSAADTAQDRAENGKKVVATTGESISELAEQISDTVPIVDQLAKDSESIGSILEVIQGIAEQTNLLALNAAIEAARAGENGRGFAVVADEVRTLASRTQDSVEQIRTVISTLQQGTTKVVTAIQQGNSKAIQVQDIAQQAEQALDEILQEMNHIQQKNSQIKTASDEQHQIALKLNDTITKIRSISQELTNDAQVSLDMSDNLTTLSQQQKALIEGFKV